MGKSKWGLAAGQWSCKVDGDVMLGSRVSLRCPDDGSELGE